jgi:hypothetical protein
VSVSVGERGASYIIHYLYFSYPLLSFSHIYSVGSTTAAFVCDSHKEKKMEEQTRALLMVLIGGRMRRGGGR